MKAAPFEYHRAATTEEAIECLAELGDDAKVLAGGQSLVPMMNFRLVQPAALLDITRASELAYLAREGELLRVGALTTHRQFECLEGVEQLEGFGILRTAARWIGHYPVRTRGTFGGSVCHADPSAEWAVLAVLLDAEIVARNASASRLISARDFFLGFLSTDLQPDELVTEIRFPRRADHAGFAEFARRHGDFAIVAAAVALELDSDGEECRAATVVVGGVDDVPRRLPDAEQWLAHTRVSAEVIEAAGRAAAASVSPPSDLHASAEYRRRLTKVLVRRAIERALGRGEFTAA